MRGLLQFWSSFASCITSAGHGRTMSSQPNMFTASSLFERVERARRRRTQFRDTHITLAHGSGGKAMHDLIEAVFVENLRNPLLEKLEDQALLTFDNDPGVTGTATRLAFTTDS